MLEWVAVIGAVLVAEFDLWLIRARRVARGTAWEWAAGLSLAAGPVALGLCLLVFDDNFADALWVGLGVHAIARMCLFLGVVAPAMAKARG